MPKQSCELCIHPGGDVVYRDDNYRIVLVDDEHYPGFCRVIWNAHVREMTDLSTAERAILIAAVWQVEEAVREVMRPDKINVASLGNVTPHVHWHVIPRYEDDAHFPNPIWGEVRRTPASADLTKRRALVPKLREAILARFEGSLL
ncbi:HIT family protein [Noviherbaspirillum autotrophicum]|uniref:Histidine triad (HIT) protein n=1 Tax=Noviherbaspirillum autotrophicum TaxID=709839 RepID=A0A0C1Y4M9_9BURK|nr:HIT family protein [Noviherbaspirillum autotrophicum]KIF81978.1 histidine triad (HIT) protein [Noviherbaspirillum autotrophicum]